MPPGLFGSTTIDFCACMEKANTQGTADATGVVAVEPGAIQRRSTGPAMSLSSRRKKATKLRRNLKSAHAKCRLIQLEEEARRTSFCELHANRTNRGRYEAM